MGNIHLWNLCFIKIGRIREYKGVYTFEEGKISIIPKEPYIPANIRLKADTLIDEWMVVFNIKGRKP